MAYSVLQIQKRIYEIRGKKVMLDSDLAALYGVEVKRLNESVKRNIKRFPSVFMFQLTVKEWAHLRSQIATLNEDTRKYKPYAFTEHGILMLYIEKNDKRVNDIIIALNNLIQQPMETKKIGFRTG